jgi:hypothetical protein
MWPVAVVMVDEAAEHSLEVAAVRISNQSRHSAGLAIYLEVR